MSLWNPKGWNGMQWTCVCILALGVASAISNGEWGSAIVMLGSFYAAVEIGAKR